MQRVDPERTDRPYGPPPSAALKNGSPALAPTLKIASDLQSLPRKHEGTDLQDQSKWGVALETVAIKPSKDIAVSITALSKLCRDLNPCLMNDCRSHI